VLKNEKWKGEKGSPRLLLNFSLAGGFRT